MPRAYPEDPDHVAARQAAFRARRAEREARLRDTQEKAREAFEDVLEQLVVVTAAYQSVAGSWDVDRIRNYHSAIERARLAYDELFKNN